MNHDRPHGILGVILASFPDARGHVDSLMKTDATFQRLCTRYDECDAALRESRGKSGMDELCEEYAAHLHSLEQEIRRYLHSFRFTQTPEAEPES